MSNDFDMADPGVDGWFFHTEGLAVARWAMNVPPGQYIVEVGTWQARSTVYLASGSLRGYGATVVSCDHFRGSCEHNQNDQWQCPPNLEEIARANLRKHGIDHLVDVWVMDSWTAAKQWKKLHPEPCVGLLLLDAAHDKESCAADLAAWADTVAVNGILACHDYGRDWVNAQGQCYNVWTGVVQAIDEWYSKHSEKWQIIPTPKTGPGEITPATADQLGTLWAARRIS